MWAGHIRNVNKDSNYMNEQYNFCSLVNEFCTVIKYKLDQCSFGKYTVHRELSALLGRGDSPMCRVKDISLK